MLTGITLTPPPANEKVLGYAPRSDEREKVTATLKSLENEQREIASVVGGKEVRTGKTYAIRPPHRHRDTIATVHQGDADTVNAAIHAAQAAKGEWAGLPFDARAAVLLRAAELLAGRFRATINAATMLGQSKTVHQAEIDAACELIDFFRFNVHFAHQILEEQPDSPSGSWNRVDYRPLDGFVLAVTPFNFTSIAGNLPTAPALMGNTVVWKTATTAAFSAQVIMDVLREAGLPDGVINLVHVPGSVVGQAALAHPDLAGIHFTGSTPTFQGLWRGVGENIASYKTYPRLVGETGGKDFIFAHASADVRALAVAIVRGAFEYQGQKCSAASRVYVPESLWPALKKELEAEVSALKMGDIADYKNFMGAVIDEKSFDKIKGYIDYARSEPGAEVWLGGGCDKSEGYFIEPTVVLADDPNHRLMQEEIFGPVVTIYRYADTDFEATLKLCDETSPYALTGAVFADDLKVVEKVMERLRFAAGNFYVNDKPTGAVVGQQPFGGGRASGTNDKAGSPLNIFRWTSLRSVKETFDPPREVGYPYMRAE